MEFLNDNPNADTPEKRVELEEWWQGERERIKASGGTIIEQHHAADSKLARLLGWLLFREH